MGRPSRRSAMDRAHLIEQLAIVTGYIDGGAALVARQRERIEFMREAGQDTTLARIVLAQLQESQKLRIADFERLDARLSCLESQPVRSS